MCDSFCLSEHTDWDMGQHPSRDISAEHRCGPLRRLRYVPDPVTGVPATGKSLRESFPFRMLSKSKSPERCGRALWERSSLPDQSKFAANFQALDTHQRNSAEPERFFNRPFGNKSQPQAGLHARDDGFR